MHNSFYRPGYWDIESTEQLTQLNAEFYNVNQPKIRRSLVSQAVSLALGLW